MNEQAISVDMDAREDHQSKKKYIKPALTEGLDIPSAGAFVPVLTPVYPA